MDHQPIKPSRKEIAEFFRLGLIARLCETGAVVRWAEKIIAADDHPHISFIELSLAEGCPTEKLIGLLLDIPGEAESSPVDMLLGHAFWMLSSGRIDTKTLILNLYRSMKPVSFPNDVEITLICIEDDLSLVTNGIHGTIEEIESELRKFLGRWKYCAPAIEEIIGLDHQA